MKISFLQNVLPSLIEEQEIAAHAEGNVLIQGGPGTGKTRIMTEATQHTFDNLTKNILCLTFSKGARQWWMKQLLWQFKGAPQFEVRTFHSFAYSFLDRPSIITEHELTNVLGDICGKDGEQMKLIIDRHKTCGLELNDIEANWFQKYERYLKYRELIDFSDLLLQCLDKVKDKYDRVFVDEYQDTSGIQYELLKRVAEEVFVMDEPCQRIYQWRDADERNIERVTNDYHPTVYPLLHDHRHARAILDYGESIYKRGMIATREEEGLVHIEHFRTEMEEAEEVAKLCNGKSTVFILAREHKLLLPSIMKLKGKDIEVVNDPGNDNKDFKNDRGARTKLMTMHSVKGKEAHRAILVGVNNGIVPHHLNNNETEERNLFYTACMRAKDELYIFSHGEPSKWL